MLLICWKRWKNWFCGVWTVKKTHSRWPSPVLIFHLTHSTCTPAFAPHTVPVSTAHLSNLPASSTCVMPAPGHGMISLWKATRSVAVWSCFTSLLKINSFMWALGCAGCWQSSWWAEVVAEDTSWALLSSLGSSHSLKAHQCSPLGISTALQTAEAGSSAEVSQLHFPLLQQGDS